MSAQILLWRLASGPMTEDEALQQRRRGYWLKQARLRADLTLSAAAELAGLNAGSGSTVSRWEAGDRPIKVIHLERLARGYGVPLDWLMRPEKTDEERLSEAIDAASDAERADWTVGEERDPGDDDAPDAGRHRRSA